MGGIRTIQLLHNAVRQAGVVWAQGFSAKCSRTLRSSASSSCSGWSGVPSVFTGRSPGLEEKTAHSRPTAIPLLKLYWLPHPPLFFCFYLFSSTRQLDFFKLILGWGEGGRVSATFISWREVFKKNSDITSALKIKPAMNLGCLTI